jgi:hypothetical protein
MITAASSTEGIVPPESLFALELLALFQLPESTRLYVPTWERPWSEIKNLSTPDLHALLQLPEDKRGCSFYTVFAKTLQRSVATGLQDKSATELLSLLQLPEDEKVYSFEQIFLSALIEDWESLMSPRKTEVSAFWETLANHPELTAGMVKYGLFYFMKSDSFTMELFWNALPVEKFTDEVIEFLLIMAPHFNIREMVALQLWKFYGKAMAIYRFRHTELDGIPLAWWLRLYMSAETVERVAEHIAYYDEQAALLNNEQGLVRVS